jgi:hypothetical protein
LILRAESGIVHLRKDHPSSMLKGYAMKTLIAALSALALLGPSAMAETAKTPKEDKVICKRQEAVGTRLGGKRICMKASEWKAAADMHKDELDREQRQSLPNAG